VKLLIKIGGTLLDERASRLRVAGGIAEAVRAGHRVVVVHGGGRQMTRFLEERGVKSSFVDGLRVTTDETLDAVLMVLAGTVNKQLVSALIETGVNAVGVSGIDGSLVEAEPLRAELGHVGRPVRSQPQLLQCLGEAGFVPVVACVAGDRGGRMFNVNADQMAVACAIGFQPERLVFLTDVDGVLDADKRPIARLSLEASQDLIDRGVATGGMLAKLRAAGEALRNGISQVVIAPGSGGSVLSALLAGDSVGTRLYKEQAHV
jgi:acetylglutamate kinase